VGGVRLGVWGVVLVVCVCVSVSVSGVLFSVGVCVCVVRVNPRYFTTRPPALTSTLPRMLTSAPIRTRVWEVVRTVVAPGSIVVECVCVCVCVCVCLCVSLPDPPLSSVPLHRFFTLLLAPIKRRGAVARSVFVCVVCSAVVCSAVVCGVRVRVTC